MVPSTHTVLGQTVAMPVEVRRATAVTAMFAVSAPQTQAMIDYSGMTAFEYRRGRAVVGIVFVRYLDGDLGPYDELGVCVLVRPHNYPGRRTTWGRLHSLVTGDAGVLIHRLPVDGAFTRAAGREIWGFPKTLAQFDTDLDGPTRRVTLRQDNKLVLDLEVRRGPRLPAPGSRVALAAYSHLDGTTRRTSWQMNPVGLRSRRGGATLQLGDHPMADELARLGLPRRALFSTTIENLPMSFGDAEVV